MAPHSPPSQPGRIVVGGEALVDVIARPGGSVDAVLGGGPYNTARTIGRLGVPASFLGAISTDRFGSRLLDGLVADGVDVGLVQRRSEPTTLALAEVDDEGSATYRFYLAGTSAPALDPVTLPDDVVAVHVGTLGLVLEPLAGVLVDMLSSLDPTVAVMVDANCRPSATSDPSAYLDHLRRALRAAHVLKVSNDDLAYLAAQDADLGDPERLLEAGPEVILLTLGGDGVEIITAHGRRSVPVGAVRVVDTIGAGDAFGGAFLAWWARQGGAPDALRDLDRLVGGVALAARVAAITCTRAGADPPRAADVEGWV